MDALTLKAAEQAEYQHPKHKDYHLRDIVTAAGNPAMSMHLGRLEPGGEIFVHTHDAQSETFYILSGEAVCTMGTEQITFGPGSCGVAPPGVPHGLRNESPEPVSLLALFTPPLK
ncbi:cupin domain-containing protein [Geoalkalibacter halelectricus]|uniref:Cupin domain-containing protein n=1 Tax=Geoalkalibacter halelectricus TaxID=2847045 RepID=A0ABY5ZQB5_9BACT|nr:cupin domain-containing protein [Geoalkalibacter halelectricus]MDO3377442.1 cupin domain-containing protein [Geoalkalibacter halelectricus]UWZ80798.1 cupin domain-containing protein [Geoalkalibacter halelectricus]